MEQRLASQTEGGGPFASCRVLGGSEHPAQGTGALESLYPKHKTHTFYFHTNCSILSSPLYERVNTSTVVWFLSLSADVTLCRKEYERSRIASERHRHHLLVRSQNKSAHTVSREFGQLTYRSLCVLVAACWVAGTFS